MAEKPKLAMYWGASCGGCEISLVNINEKILDVDAHFDFMFCPCLMDTKKKDIEALPDKSIAITLFNGAIRTGENEEMAHLLRRKSQVLVAFGSCAKGGSIPALSNLHSRTSHFVSSYIDSPTIDNPTATTPGEKTEVAEGTLTLPAFHDTVRTLAQTVPVDYYIPGCPPESQQIWNVVELIVSGATLPPAGSVIGGGRSTVCDECSRTKEEKKVGRFYRSYEVIPDPEKCLLEQGLLCMGVATRDGCGALCPQVNTPCTGCYGNPEGAGDQGAKMLGALGSIIDIGEVKGVSEAEIHSRIESVISSIPDYAGTFYKYSLAESILRGAANKDKN
ncbi:NADH:ubiquinone oxidoreductase [Geobacter sp. DSM 9736]|uniref:NADH-quinone oxidoreductase subunit B family protein n=1 Tax=Geobacter sp. DSM 9736 TaxID=1277350 RepID=UPI000B504776|nr:NADH:ubiquinone oxidoreductase [Geobacter sp. DSM 9736]SNB44950.1 F420-non-reducing hydrogenase subunit G [Geobacter sp. DSM 9736]